MGVSSFASYNSGLLRSAPTVDDPADEVAAGSAGEYAGKQAAGAAQSGNAGTPCMETGQPSAGTTGGKIETYYRTMSQADYETFLKTGKVPATGETFISPTQSFAEGYDGVTVKFEVKAGTTSALEQVGVRNMSKLTNKLYPDLPIGQSGWGQNNAYFKAENDIINIGLGQGTALDIFNENILNFTPIGGK